MRLLYDLPCWEIMQCEDVEDCPVWQQQYDVTECWEVVREFEDYRSSYDICEDCLVYVLKHQNRVFTEKEIKAMTAARCDCRTVGKQSRSMTA